MLSLFSSCMWVSQQLTEPAVQNGVSSSSKLFAIVTGGRHDSSQGIRRSKQDVLVLEALRHCHLASDMMADKRYAFD
ncbi:hypothetical protein FIBSPDRAFT_963074 [Athelia psychrophila]|uniref:Uncharacterized protein n=1 Tax=Athelia psychrophila TaxID=1759441 RepID=A0A165ZDD4_9AGAM|nr:hypothetical protein FIBSPDRAFT_963074 [Fibularhizoctonia sp. CBS 109695]